MRIIDRFDKYMTTKDLNDNQVTVSMSFRIPIDTRAELNAFLKERGLSMADFVKAALNTMK